MNNSPERIPALSQGFHERLTLRLRVAHRLDTERRLWRQALLLGGALLAVVLVGGAYFVVQPGSVPDWAASVPGLWGRMDRAVAPAGLDLDRLYRVGAALLVGAAALATAFETYYFVRRHD